MQQQAQYWIGGSPCAGKSSVAALLADRHGLEYFHCDVNTDGRVDKMRQAGVQVVNELAELGKCARLSKSPAWQCEHEVVFYKEQFRFVLNEIQTESSKPILAEGADLMPELVLNLGVPVKNAVWIVPTEEFQLKHYATREWAHDYVKECAEPDKAFDNWMQRDVLFARHVGQSAKQLGGKLILVDGSRSIDDVAAEVATHFGLS